MIYWKKITKLNPIDGKKYLIHTGEYAELCMYSQNGDFPYYSDYNDNSMTHVPIYYSEINNPVVTNKQ